MAWFRDSFLGSHQRGGRNATAHSATASAAPTRTWPPVGERHRFIYAVQGPGDLIYVPSLWAHAVVNLADSFALAYE